MTKSDEYESAVCACCHKHLMAPTKYFKDALRSAGWQSYEHGPEAFCSNMCIEMGPSPQIREPLAMHVRLSDKRIPFKLGVWAALGGYDVLSDDPVYIEGHAAGMQFRAIGEAAIKKMESEHGAG